MKDYEKRTNSSVNWRTIDWTKEMKADLRRHIDDQTHTRSVCQMQKGVPLKPVNRQFIKKPVIKEFLPKPKGCSITNPGSGSAAFTGEWLVLVTTIILQFTWAVYI